MFSNKTLAAPDLFHMFTQSIIIKFHDSIELKNYKVQMF